MVHLLVYQTCNFFFDIVLDSKEVLVVSLKVVSSSLAICFNFSIRYMLI